MAVRKRKQNQVAPADSARLDPQNSLGVAAFEAVDDNVVSAAGSLVAKGADVLSDGGSALGGIARAGMRGAGSLPFNTAADAVADAARGTASAAGGVAGSSAEAALNATGAVLSIAGDLVGPALDAAGDVAGSVLGAAADAAGDLL
jgi:hypothetical protein